MIPQYCTTFLLKKPTSTENPNHGHWVIKLVNVSVIFRLQRINKRIKITGNICVTHVIYQQIADENLLGDHYLVQINFHIW